MVFKTNRIWWWDIYHIISYHISYLSIESRRLQGIANPDLSREVVGGVDGGDHAVDGEEGGEVGRVRGDQDQREEPPDPTLASTRVLFVLNYCSDEDLGWGTLWRGWTCNPVYGSLRNFPKFINQGLKSNSCITYWSSSSLTNDRRFLQNKLQPQGRLEEFSSTASLAATMYRTTLSIFVTHTTITELPKGFQVFRVSGW